MTSRSRCISPETSVLAGVEPAAFWTHFEAITRIARPSHEEEQISEHVRRWAADQGFRVDADAAGNLVVRVPASAAPADAPTVILRGHLDMVCERDPASAYDPRQGRIGLVAQDGWLTADGSTLGADNGVALAAMMALAEDRDAQHGPLELLMTVAEEVGLEGANRLEGKLLSGSILGNLDSFESGTLTVGCAGSVDSWLRIGAPRASIEGETVFAVSAGGGLGGHSGNDMWSRSLAHDDDRDLVAEHRALAYAALAHDADRAAELLIEHMRRTERVLLQFATSSRADVAA